MGTSMTFPGRPSQLWLPGFKTSRLPPGLWCTRDESHHATSPCLGSPPPRTATDPSVSVPFYLSSQLPLCLLLCFLTLNTRGSPPLAKPPLANSDLFSNSYIEEPVQEASPDLPPPSCQSRTPSPMLAPRRHLTKTSLEVLAALFLHAEEHVSLLEPLGQGSLHSIT